jgi:hypothetical protein
VKFLVAVLEIGSFKFQSLLEGLSSCSLESCGLFELKMFGIQPKDLLFICFSDLSIHCSTTFM